MTKWIVFEAGSRAGLSARMFYEDYIRRTRSDDILLMQDTDLSVVQSINARADKSIGMVHGVWTGFGTTLSEISILYSKDTVVFPADELTRQKDVDLNVYGIRRRWFNDVLPIYYNKTAVNAELSPSGVRVPQTFDLNEVFVKPNTMSAGSRGLQSLSNVCVQQKLDIAEEFVVDCFVSENFDIEAICAREVKLRSGYDKLIRLLPETHSVYEFAKKIIASKHGMFRGVCHLQIARTNEMLAPYYYIEGSKRISGTSLVNLLVGYNPFMLLQGSKYVRTPYDEEWHSYEDLLCEVNHFIYD